MATHQLTQLEADFVDIRKVARGDSDVHTPTGSYQGANANPFVANAAGTTTTIVGALADVTTSLNVLRINERFMLFTSAGVPKEDTVFRVTAIANSVSCTVTFTPAAKAATASGDQVRLVAVDAMASMNALDAFLQTAAGGSYTQAAVDKMNMNDKIYAFRVATDLAGTRGF